MRLFLGVVALFVSLQNQLLGEDIELLRRPPSRTSRCTCTVAYVHSPRWPEACQRRQLGDDGSETNGTPTEQRMAEPSGKEKAAEEEPRAQPALIHG